MMHDLRILDGTRPDRHEGFKEHYPDGYRMMFVPADEVKGCEGLMKAYELNQVKAMQVEAQNETNPA